jgi:hypothetical protein
VTPRQRRRNIAQGTKIPHDGLAEVSVRLDHGRHEGLTGLQMASMRPVLAPASQSGSSVSSLGGSSNVGQAAGMNHGHIQQGGTMGRGKGHLNVGPRPLMANGCSAHGSLTGPRTRTTAYTSGPAAESFLPVVVPTRVAPAQAMQQARFGRSDLTRAHVLHACDTFGHRLCAVFPVIREVKSLCFTTPLTHVA